MDMNMDMDDLYFLAFDHRGVFARSVLDVDAPTAADEAVIADCKDVLLTAAVRALGDADEDAAGRFGVLVDERYGAAAARRALEAGLVLAMPVEKPDRAIFDFAYGDAFGEHVERFDPHFAKVLVRYNAEGDAIGNRLQLERLARLSAWLRERGRSLLFELLVEPTPAQLAVAGGDRLRFELELRPALIEAGMRAVQAAGVHVDVWKLEGVDDLDDAARIAATARAPEGSERTRCTILGAGADRERVEHWLRVAAATDGFGGFAIGRSIWRAPLRDLLAGAVSENEALQRIAQGYRDFVEVYADATSVASPTAGGGEART